LTLTMGTSGGLRGQEVAPYAIDIPPWFATTFLDFREDIADAAKDGRRLLVYFGQDGCPYCKQLMVTNFSQRSIVDKTRRQSAAHARQQATGGNLRNRRLLDMRRVASGGIPP